MFEYLHNAGPRTGDQVLDGPHTAKITIEQQKLDTNTQGDQAWRQGPEYMFQEIVRDILSLV